MRTLVDSLKRLYENGLNGKKPSITKGDVLARAEAGKITEEEYKYITGLEMNADE
jgi:hypothetical protein